MYNTCVTSFVQNFIMNIKSWPLLLWETLNSHNKYILKLSKLEKFPHRNNSNTACQHNYCPKLEKLMNDQIRAEQQAAQDYLAMAVSFLHPMQARPGAGGFFMKMYEEEIEHSQIFIQYQLLRGGIPAIGSLSAPKVNMELTLLEAFTKGLEMEKCITESIENIVRVAEGEKDFQCADFLTSVFLAEQMKSINEFASHIARLSRLCDEHAIYHYDLKLRESHQYKPKSVPPSNNSVNT